MIQINEKDHDLRNKEKQRVGIPFMPNLKHEEPKIY